LVENKGGSVMKDVYYFTFTKMDAFHGCIQPVRSKNKEEAVRVIRTTYGDDWDRIYTEQEGKTARENEGLLLLDEIGA